MEGVDALLQDAQRWLDEPTDAMVVVDHEAFRRLPAEVAVHRSGLALATGDVDGAVALAQQALDLALDDDHLSRGAASALRGLAAWGSGDLETAEASYTECLVHFERIGHVGDIFGCSIAHADMRLTLGRLRDAMDTFDKALRLASRPEGAVVRGTADMHVGMAAIRYELDDLAAARRELARSLELGEHTALPQNAYRYRVVMAKVSAAEGDLDCRDRPARRRRARVRRRLLAQRAPGARGAGRDVAPAGTAGRRARLGQPAGPGGDR